MEPLCMDEAAAVGKDDIENAATCSSLDDPAAVNASVNRSVLTDSQRRQGNEVRAILIGLGEVEKEILNGPDASRCK